MLLLLARKFIYFFNLKRKTLFAPPKKTKTRFSFYPPSVLTVSAFFRVSEGTPHSCGYISFIWQ